ncbi:MAG TPA: hypothetical protein VK177_16910 [Flavobacteriales bacterium]|nr:hypothetical protein [Flavobacteriales bacterium]
MKFLIPIPLLLIFSCGSEKKESAKKQDDTIAVPIPVFDSIPDFTKCYCGKIGTYEIEMCLSKGGNFLSGVYKYKSQKEFLKLEGAIDSTGKIILSEYVMLNNYAGNTGVFTGRINASIFQGVWVQGEGGKKLDFELEEINENELSFKEADPSQVYINKGAGSKEHLVHYPARPHIAKTINSAIGAQFPLSRVEYFIYENYLSIDVYWEAFKYTERSEQLFDLRTGIGTHGLEMFEPTRRKELLDVISDTLYGIYEREITCYERPEKIEWPDIRIVLKPEIIEFRYTYGYMESCRAQEEGCCRLTWIELDNYLAKHLKNEPKDLITIQGDFNGDGKPELAHGFISQEGYGSPQDGGKANEYSVSFSGNLPRINDIGCCEVFLINEGDLNNDGADEISIYQAPLNGRTYTMATYSFANGSWKQIHLFLIPTAFLEGDDWDLQEMVYKQNGSIYYKEVNTNAAAPKFNVVKVELK